MNNASTSAPVNGSWAGTPALVAALVVDTPALPEAEVEVGMIWLTPARLVPEEVNVEATPLSGFSSMMTGKVTTTAPQPLALTALTRMERLLVPTLRPSM
jgi:hypothetical protein